MDMALCINVHSVCAWRVGCVASARHLRPLSTVNYGSRRTDTPQLLARSWRLWLAWAVAYFWRNRFFLIRKRRLLILTSQQIAENVETVLTCIYYY